MLFDAKFFLRKMRAGVRRTLSCSAEPIRFHKCGGVLSIFLNTTELCSYWLKYESKSHWSMKSNNLCTLSIKWSVHRHFTQKCFTSKSIELNSGYPIIPCYFFSSHLEMEKYGISITMMNQMFIYFCRVVIDRWQTYVTI